MKNIDVISMGELLIDFTTSGLSEQGNQLFEANPGGAPCNVLSMLSNLGKRSAFIGKVGNDQFGRLLKKTIEGVGINAEYLLIDDVINTTLAFVHTAPDGDRSFSFYRKPGADMMLAESEIDETVIEKSRIFHFGTLSMTDDVVRKATKVAIEYAKKHRLIISFDPNLRLPLWDSMELAREQIKYGLSQCDIVKISEEELEFITGTADISEGAKLLQKEYDITLMSVTLGSAGSIAFYKNQEVRVDGFSMENTVDTTGAGDTFCGCILNYILESGLEALSEENLREMLTFANAAAALVTTKKGAICVVPAKDEIIEFLKSRNGGFVRG